MRNLKRILSAALALVMSMSIATVASASVDFKDTDEIEHLEAVDAMTAIGVLEGYNGDFDPDGTLTREQAAKIIAYILLGDKAEKLGNVDTGFKDVAADRWSAPYIGYCASVGIVNGMGDGTFDPEGKLTGYAFSKMLLCALGYGENDEYVGAGWTLNVARDGVQTNLFKDAEVDNGELDRDNAAQLAFNAVRANLVSWSELFGTYSAYTTNFGKQELLGTLAENVFKMTATYRLDDFGFNTRAWKVENKVLTDYYISDTIIDTITDATVAEGTLYKNYTFEKTCEVYVNGKAQADLTSASWKSSANKALANGETLYLVDTDDNGEVDKLISTIEYLAKVTKVTEATSKSDRMIDMKVWNGNSEATPIVANKVECEDFEKDQYILVIPNEASANPFENPLAMTAAETVTGKVNAYYKVTNTGSNPNGYVTIEGTKYAYNCIFGTNEALGSDIAEDKYSLNDATYAAYLDSNGYIVGVEEIESAITDYAYIISKGEDAFQSHNVAKVLLSNGEIGTYTISSKSDAYAIDNNGIANNDGSDAKAGRIFGYSINDKNEIVLTDFTGTKYAQVSSAKANNSNGYTGYANADVHAGGTTPIYQSGNISFTKGYSTINWGSSKYAYATDSTIFLYVNGNSVWSYVGKSNAPTIDAARGLHASIVVKNTNNTNYAEIVVIEGTPADSFTNNYVYVLDGSYMGYSYDTKGDKVYYYDVVKNGERTVIAADVATGLAAGRVYKYNVDEDLFTGDDNYNVEAGEYTLDVAGSNSGYNFVDTPVTIDVSSNGNVIVDSNGTPNTNDDENYVIDAETKTTIIYTVDGTLSTAIKEVSTSDAWAVGDTAMVVYKTVNNLKVAQDLFIVKQYDAPNGGPTGFDVTGVNIAKTAAGTITASLAGVGTIPAGHTLTVELWHVDAVHGNALTATNTYSYVAPGGVVGSYLTVPFATAGNYYVVATVRNSNGAVVDQVTSMTMYFA